jgi:hypothetical protein
MNNTFNLKRFGMLFKKHTLEHGKAYLLSTGVLTGLMFICLLYMSFISGGHLNANAQIPVFLVELLLAGSIFTSNAFSDLGNKSKGIPTLMIPASHFEKYLVVWLYTYVIFQVVFVAVFYLTGEIVLTLGKHDLPTDKLVNVFDTENDSWYTFVIYGLLHSFAFFGAVHFKKLHFIKTAITFFICVLLLVIINGPMLGRMVNADINAGLPFQRLLLGEKDQYIAIDPSRNMISASYCVLALVVLLLWITTYFKLKEKEV